MSERKGRRGLLRALLGAEGAPATTDATPDAPSRRTREPAAGEALGSAAPARVTATSGFSLEGFYAARAVSPPPEVPVAPLREGLPVVPTTRVGLCPDAEELDLEQLVREREGVS